MCLQPTTGLLLVLALPALIPLATVVAAVLAPDREVWSHLLEHVLPDVIGNTLLLVVGVGFLSGCLGTALAWLTALCDFPGRRFFDWALMLPLAIPGYVLAFIAVGFLDYSGPLQTWLRDVVGPHAWVPPIRSAGGVIVVLSLALYPYVYLLARGAFLTQGQRAIEAAQTLGLSRTRSMMRVALPLARPWVAAGIALVCMETLADFGTVAVFNYDTFTTAIYRAWFGLFSTQAALELSGVLMAFVLIALAFERRTRGQARFNAAWRSGVTPQRTALSPVMRWLACLAAGCVFALAFALPVLALARWALAHAAMDLDARYIGFVWRSLALAGGAAALIVVASVALAYIERRSPSRANRVLARLATSGYAIPGTVLAVGLLVPIIALNNLLQDALRSIFNSAAPTLLLQGTLLTVFLAYCARFMTVGFNPIDSGLQRVTRHIDEAAISLGVSGRVLIRRIHLPLLRTGLATAGALVFVDVMKEMPITLLTRPFGWDTLAVRVFEMTSEGEWERAALPALAIVAVGLAPTMLLARRGAHVG